MDKAYVERVFRPMPDWFERRDRVPEDYADYGRYDRYRPRNLYRERLEAIYGPVDEMEVTEAWANYLANDKQHD